jgi:CheY-like chemotaxis protein
VDDEEPVRSVAQGLLAHLGFDARTATDGEDAVRQIEAGLRPDAILLDVVMPGMGGVEAFHCIRALLPEIPVLISSGFSDRASAESLMREGLNGSVTKPYRLETLARRLREVLR